MVVLVCACVRACVYAVRLALVHSVTIAHRVAFFAMLSAACTKGLIAFTIALPGLLERQTIRNKMCRFDKNVAAKKPLIQRFGMRTR